MGKTGEKPTKAEDIRLVELALKQDQSAFTLLLKKYHKPLMTHVMKYVSVTEDAEDICQRSFEKAFMNIVKYNSQFAFSTWLYNIAQNEAIDHLRRNKSSIASVSINETEVLEILSDATPEDDFIIDQAVNELIDSIHNLPLNYSSVAELRFIKDYAYEDIAKELNLPLGTVKTRLNRARKMLEAQIEKSEDELDS